MRHRPFRTLFKPLARTFAALAASAAALGTAQAAPTWITIGEKAHGLMARVAPQARTLASRNVPVTVPVQRRSAALTTGQEAVYAVEIDDDMLPTLSLAVHRNLRKCGGYIQHASQAEALAALDDLMAPPTPARAPSYVIDNVAQVNGLLPQMQASLILSTIQSLSNFQNRRYNSSHGVAASTWLFNTWAALGNVGRRDVRVTQFTHAGWGQKSVSFEIDGSGPDNGEVIIMGAHLDSIASGGIETARAPGADDDASGVAALTEIIRVLMANNYVPNRSLRFVAYAAEEVGLLGSRDIALSYNAERKRVVGVMQLDMTAFQGDATDLWIYTDYTNAAQNQFVASLAAVYLPQLTVGYDICGYGCSDHASWHNRGYAASFPFEASDDTYNFAIHTPNDTIATFGNQANHALKFTKLGLAFAVELTSPSPLAKTASRAGR